MIAALEGPVALTECQLASSHCEHEGSCLVQQPWSVINHAVQNTLSTITLADLISPAFPRSTSVLALSMTETSILGNETSTPATENPLQVVD